MMAVLKIQNLSAKNTIQSKSSFGFPFVPYLAIDTNYRCEGIAMQGLTRN